MEEKLSSTISQATFSNSKDPFSYALENIEQFLTEEVEERSLDSVHVNPLTLQAMENSFLQVLCNDQYIPSPARQNLETSLVENRTDGKLSTNYHEHISCKSGGDCIDVVSISDASGGAYSPLGDRECVLLQFQKGLEEAQRFLPCKNLLNLDSYDEKLHKKMRPPKSQDEGKCCFLDAITKVMNKNHQMVTREKVERETQTLEIQEDEEDELLDLFEKLYLGQDTDHNLPYKAINKIVSTSKGAGITYGRSLSVSEEMLGMHLRSLLLDCAKAIQNNNTPMSVELLKNIRKQSTPFGDWSQRLAHYFANGLDSRLTSTGSQLYHTLDTKLLSSTVDISEAQRSFISICPFRIVAFYFANEHISNIVNKGTALHIIYFGIGNGFECSRIIHHLSARLGGPPPKIRVTAMDDPQASKEIKKAGHLLANYGKRYNVQLEYNGIAKKWETMCIEDLSLERDEAIVVINMLRFDTLLDEVVGENNPRSVVLNLVRKINPDILINLVKNGSYNNTPLFLPRFREALYHYATWFEMLDTNMSREDSHRMFYERHVFGRELSNIIACEGADRVERALSCKQWEIQIKMVGFTPLLSDEERVKTVKAIVKSAYHKNFFIEEGGPWILQGWKGRILCGIGCWIPTPTKQ